MNILGQNSLSSIIFTPPKKTTGFLDATSSTAKATSPAKGFGAFEFFNSKGFGGALAAVGAATDIFNAFSSYTNARKSLKEQKRINNLLEQQYHKENQRYEENKKKREEADKIVADAASLYELPTQRD
ncbi:hypothetical protein [Helicobacter mesocricetorum]|uniref:hypothetical protein n=1 Tax=Helicobacter mesocricetorum TaxID=87012 RepID=UPI000CF034E7|nr:hypothetical protein [Helicobacter mesocricetorum]